MHYSSSHDRGRCEGGVNSERTDSCRELGWTSEQSRLKVVIPLHIY